MPRKGSRCRILLRPKGCPDEAPETVGNGSPCPPIRPKRLPMGSQEMDLESSTIGLSLAHVQDLGGNLRSAAGDPLRGRLGKPHGNKHVTMSRSSCSYGRQNYPTFNRLGTIRDCGVVSIEQLIRLNPPPIICLPRVSSCSSLRNRLYSSWNKYYRSYGIYHVPDIVTS